MSRLNLLAEGKSYAFCSYCEMPYKIDEILTEFGMEILMGMLTADQLTTA